jgi:DNA-directed RNA polymerase specialized sigma24 family protein
MPETSPPSEDEFNAAFAWATGHVAQWGRGKCDELRELGHDAAMEALVWARNNYRPDRGRFEPFAAAAVRRVMGRWVARWAADRKKRPGMISLTPFLRDDEDDRSPLAVPDRPREGIGYIPLSAAARDLPQHLRDAVRLFFVDGFTLIECGMLLGASKWSVREWLAEAARLLGEGQDEPEREFKVPHMRG